MPKCQMCSCVDVPFPAPGVTMSIMMKSAEYCFGQQEFVDSTFRQQFKYGMQ